MQGLATNILLPQLNVQSSVNRALCSVMVWRERWAWLVGLWGGSVLCQALGRGSSPCSEMAKLKSCSHFLLGWIRINEVLCYHNEGKRKWQNYESMKSKATEEKSLQGAVFKEQISKRRLSVCVFVWELCVSKWVVCVCAFVCMCEGERLCVFKWIV